MDLADQVAAFFDAQSLWGTGGVVALSGGPDSVALARLLLDPLRQGRLRSLTLAHLNHGLRGPDSDADASFVPALAESWSREFSVALGCQTRLVDVRSEAALARDNLEATARRERYGWLTQVARDEGASWVAAGHNADDQAETVLFRFLRGSGLRGLAAMAPRRSLAPGVDLVRPLLRISRAEILAYLAAQRQTFREDASNRDVRLTRNRLRHELLPVLRASYNPAIVDVLGRLAEQAAAVQAEQEQAAAALLQAAELPRAGAVVVLRGDVIGGAAEHGVREMFRLLWKRERWPAGRMGFLAWQRLVDVSRGHGNGGDFPGRIRVRRRGEVVQIWQR